MKRLQILFILFLVSSTVIVGQVTIGAAVNRTDISGNEFANSSSPARTNLSDIIKAKSGKLDKSLINKEITKSIMLYQKIDADKMIFR
jgi:hypothetical protein